jgi:hypothetical protein
MVRNESVVLKVLHELFEQTVAPFVLTVRRNETSDELVYYTGRILGSRSGHHGGGGGFAPHRETRKRERGEKLQIFSPTEQRPWNSLQD